jgi:hypothetical protein
LYPNKDTIPHAIQEISDNSGIVSDLSDIPKLAAPCAL